MPLDGNGNYNRAVSQAVAGTTIQAAYYNTEQNDIGATLGQMLPRDGQASMTGPFRLPDGNVATPAFSFNGEASTGLFRPGTGVLGFSVQAGERMRLFGNGNLVIGSVSDGGQKLQVTGTAAITGNATVGGTLGVSSTLSVTGAVTLSSTLGVTGATTIGSTLGVTGVTTLSRFVANAPNAASAFNDFAINGTVFGYIGDRTGVLGSGSGLALRSEGAFYVSAGGATERFSISAAGAATFTGTVTAPTFVGALTGTASNASLLGGYAVSAAQAINTVALRDGSGYTYFNYISSNTGNGESGSTGIGQVITTTGTDNFYRKASIGSLATAVGAQSPIATGTWQFQSAASTAVGSGGALGGRCPASC